MILTQLHPSSARTAPVRETMRPALFGAKSAAAQNLAAQPLRLTVRPDSVTFQGHFPLSRKYDIKPSQVDIVQADPAAKLPVSKSELLEHLLEAHEHARKNKLLGNLSGRQYASNMLMANGQWALGTNIELTRDTVLCGERSALINSWNQAMMGLPLDQLEDAGQAEKAQGKLKANLLAMATGNSPTDPAAGSPCSECQSWMATNRYFSPDTQVASLGRDEQTGRYVIKLRSMRELLPVLDTQTPSKTERPLDAQAVSLSADAAPVANSLGLNRGALTNLLQHAQTAYDENTTAPHSGKNTGAAVLLSNGKIIPGQRFDWTARWFESPELTAAVSGIQQELREHPDAPPPRIVAVAYYGDAVAPEVRNLGILAQQTWGGPDTLIAVVENGVPQVRTIREYMTDIYISPNSHSGRK